MTREEMLGPAVSPETGEAYERGTGYKGISIGATLLIAFGIKIFFWTGGATNIEQEVAAGVRQAQAQLPIRVDEITTITAITSSGNRVIYSVRLAADAPTGEIPAAQREMQGLVQQGICGTRESRRMVEAGAVLVYNFTDESGDRFSNEIRSCAPA